MNIRRLRKNLRRSSFSIGIKLWSTSQKSILAECAAPARDPANASRPRKTVIIMHETFTHHDPLPVDAAIRISGSSESTAIGTVNAPPGVDRPEGGAED